MIEIVNQLNNLTLLKIKWLEDKKNDSAYFGITLANMCIKSIWGVA